MTLPELRFHWSLVAVAFALSSVLAVTLDLSNYVSGLLVGLSFGISFVGLSEILLLRK